jgi:hypothetical protein
MPDPFVTRLLSAEPHACEPPPAAGYHEQSSLTLDADRRPYVVSAGTALMATRATMDIDTRNVRDVGPAE